MRITIAAGLYPPDIGGPATYAAMLESELPVRGFEVKVVPFGWVRHYPKIIRHVVYTYKLWQESKGSEIVYALDPISVGVPAFFVSKIRNNLFLVRLGGDYAWEQGRVRFGVTDTLDEYLENIDKQPVRVKIFSKLQTWVVSQAKRVIVPSKYLKEVVKKWGIEQDKIEIIYSALHKIEVSDSREKLQRQLSYTDPTIVSAGRLVPWKGFMVLIDVVVKLQKQYPQLSLIIIGDGEDMNKLRMKVEDLKISDRVRFTGSLSKEALGATVKMADVFVLNTAYEGLSHQLIEVMDIGTPIVTTNIGGNPELITNGINGYLVEYNNCQELEGAIKRVINHPESREKIVQSARVRTKDFSHEQVLERLEILLNEIYDKI